jgi:hypothetical protein
MSVIIQYYPPNQATGLKKYAIHITMHFACTAASKKYLENRFERPSSPAFHRDNTRRSLQKAAFTAFHHGGHLIALISVTKLIWSLPLLRITNRIIAVTAGAICSSSATIYEYGLNSTLQRVEKVHNESHASLQTCGRSFVGAAVCRSHAHFQNSEQR